MSFVLLSVISPPGWVAGQDRGNTGAVVYNEGETSSYSRAVFAHYLAYQPNPVEPAYAVNCAISISNVCAVPPGSGLDFYIGERSEEGVLDSGGFVIYLYDRDGKLWWFSSREHTFLNGRLIGAGLNEDGTLQPGQTFTVNLHEILAAIQGIPVADVETFVGYGWVLSEFDCLAGTYSTTIYGYGFTQAFEFKPAMGQGYQFGGLMLPLD